MRLRLIAEAFNHAKHQKQVEKVSAAVGIDPTTLVRSVERIDPSGKFVPWILRQVAFKNIRVPEDDARVRSVVDNFKQHQRKLPDRDINSYRTIHDLEEALESVVGTASKRSGGFQVNPATLPGVKVLNRIGQHTLYEVNDAGSLSEMGEGTKWCTRKSYENVPVEYEDNGCDIANEYLDEHGRLYIISEGDRPIIQFTPDFEQVMDVNDQDVSLQPYRQLLEPLGDEIAYDGAHDEITGYAKYVVNGRWPEGEIGLLAQETSPVYLVLYARRFINGRWLEAEPQIMRHASASYDYAVYILQSRWLEAELNIIRDPWIAAKYAKEFMNGQWPEAERYLMQQDAKRGTSTSMDTYNYILGRK